MLTLVIIYKYFICFAGISLSMSASAQTVNLNEAVTLTCTATDAAGAVYQLTFNSANVIGYITWLDQKADSCDVFTDPPPGYSAACGSGTDDSTSTSRSYTLMINNIKETDITTWWCAQDGSTKTESNNVTLSLRSKIYFKVLVFLT